MRARGKTARTHPLSPAAALYSAPLLVLFSLASPVHAQNVHQPIAGAFVFPVGDELDFKKPAAGEGHGFYVSDPYLKFRKARKRRAARVHYGVDLSSGRGGLAVRAIAAGVVEVSDGNAMIQVRKAERVKLPKVVNGKRTYTWSTRYRKIWKWRTGWGNRVVIRHRLPDGQTVFSLYAHLMARSVSVRAGDVVSAGQQLGKVGRTGRASAPHLHLEIRTTRISEMAEISNPDDTEAEEGVDEGVRPETDLPHTVDPLAFLVDHVLRFEDLEPGSWQARYALAAAKDGVMSASRRKFEPDDEVTREDFYAALVAAFRLGTSFTKTEFQSHLDALIDTGLLDPSTRSDLNARDRVQRSEALELILRCLDRGAARGLSMSRLASEQLARDFNMEFAGRDAAFAAERESRRLAAAETEKLRSEAAAAAERKAKRARERGLPPPKRGPKIQPVKPSPMLDPGFESLAQSDKNLSRAEVCLLIASALRLGSSNLSALERAATRAAKTG